MKRNVLLLAVVFTTLLSTGCSDEKLQPDYRTVIDFESATLASSSGYTNILWGKEMAVETDGVKIFDGILYKEDAASFGSYYSSQFGDFWSGISVSSNNDRETAELSNQFSAYASKVSKFAVVFDGSWAGSTSDYDVPTMTFDQPVTIVSADITNSTYTYHYCKNNPKVTISETEQENMWLKITLTGYNKGTKKGAEEIYLFHDGKIVSDWTEFRFFELEDVDKVVFSFDSNDRMGEWLNPPVYFCMDNIRLR